MVSQFDPGQRAGLLPYSVHYCVHAAVFKPKLPCNTVELETLKVITMAFSFRQYGLQRV